MNKKTNFDLLLERELKDPAFAEGFRRSGEVWDIALRIAKLRESAGLTQKELAHLAGTTQQQISRLENPGYGGHSLRMLDRVARALQAEVCIEFRPISRRKVRAGKEAKATGPARRG